jgi:tetratricopeptide (TPR) repeat protein
VLLALLLVIAGCGRTHTDGSPRELLEKGWGHFRLEEFGEAREAFAAALEKMATANPAPLPEGGTTEETDHLRLHATYGLALIASLERHGEQTAEARRLFQQIIAQDHSPARDMAAWAALALVRDSALPATADAAVDRAALRQAYTNVIDTYPQAPAAVEAFLYRTEMLVETLEPADARQAVEEIRTCMAAHPAGRLRTALLALQSAAHQTLREYRQALDTAIASVESKEADPSNPRANNILEYYRIAMMAQFDVGDFAVARAYYAKFLAEYPRDQRAFAVKLLVEHLDRTEAALRDGRPAPELSDIVENARRGAGAAVAQPTGDAGKGSGLRAQGGPWQH